MEGDNKGRWPYVGETDCRGIEDDSVVRCSS